MHCYTAGLWVPDISRPVGCEFGDDRDGAEKKGQ